MKAEPILLDFLDQKVKRGLIEEMEEGSRDRIEHMRWRKSVLEKEEEKKKGI